MAKNKISKTLLGWEGYGFTFSHTHRNGNMTKWYAILNYLAHHGYLSKRDIFNAIDPLGYNHAPIETRRGWNSYVFSALHKNGYIKYKQSTRKWGITHKGLNKWRKTTFNMAMYN